MRYLSSIRAVPLPDLSFLAVQILTLVVFLVINGRALSLAGTTTTALQIAIGFFVLATLARNMMFGPTLRRGVRKAIPALCAVAVASTGVIVAVGSASEFAFKMAITAWVLTHALILILVSRLGDKARERFPLIWAGSPEYGREACLLTSLGYTLRGVTLAALAFTSSNIAWVAFLTLGWIVLGFLTNWVIVMMIWSKLDQRN